MGPFELLQGPVQPLSQGSLQPMVLSSHLDGLHALPHDCSRKQQCTEDRIRPDGHPRHGLPEPAGRGGRLRPLTSPPLQPLMDGPDERSTNLRLMHELQTLSTPACL